ncbi:MAG: DUF4252 domain-containing protein [Muribaculaceae bacterium]|nr:DUF4252 domain-containing protein [Muribaculaceae bacterium]
MKRIILFLLISILSLSVTSHAKSTAKSLFAEFSSESGAESVNISPFMIKLSRLIAGNLPETEILKQISSVKVLDLENCSADVKSRFAKRAADFSADGMEELINASENGEKVRMFTINRDNLIRKLVVLCYSVNGECCVVEINGKFNLDQLDSVYNSQKPNHRN